MCIRDRYGIVWDDVVCHDMVCGVWYYILWYGVFIVFFMVWYSDIFLKCGIVVR